MSVNRYIFSFKMLVTNDRFNSFHLKHFYIFKSMFILNKYRKYEEKKKETNPCRFPEWTRLSLSKNVSIKHVQKLGVGKTFKMKKEIFLNIIIIQNDCFVETVKKKIQIFLMTRKFNRTAFIFVNIYLHINVHVNFATPNFVWFMV